MCMSILQPSSTQNWIGSQGSSSGLIVKRTIRVDIPVDQFPNVWQIFSLHFDSFSYGFAVLTFDAQLSFYQLCAVQLCWASPRS